MKQIGCALLLLLAGCASVRSTKDIPAVAGFEYRHYLGDWYEVARLPNVYERDLTDVSFNYDMRGIRLDYVRRGFCEDRERTVTSHGYFEESWNIGEFRLGFLYDFGILHRVIWVSKDYTQAIVTGTTFDDLWILARKKQIPQADLDMLVKKAQEMGFDTSKIEYTKHTR